MELTYPHTEVFDINEKTLAFEDGFVLAIPERTFSQEVEVTIDKIHHQSSAEIQPLTSAYTFTGDPAILGELSRSAQMRIPLLDGLPESRELTLLAAGPGEEMPDPDRWEPQPDIDIDIQEGDALTLALDSLMSFYVASMVVPELSYPHTTTLDSRERTLIFDNGFVLVAPEGTFAEPVEVTVDKFEVQSNRRGRPLTDAYTFGGDTESLQELSRELKLVVPTTADAPRPNPNALSLRGTGPGEEMPDPDRWEPQPDVDIDVQDEALTLSLGEVRNFYVALGAGAGPGGTGQPE